MNGGPKYLTGTMAAATSGDTAKLELLAVTREDGKKAVLLMNKADHALQVGVAASLLPGVKGAQRIDADGFQTDV